MKSQLFATVFTVVFASILLLSSSSFAFKLTTDATVTDAASSAQQPSQSLPTDSGSLVIVQYESPLDTSWPITLKSTLSSFNSVAQTEFLSFEQLPHRIVHFRPQQGFLVVLSSTNLQDKMDTIRALSGVIDVSFATTQHIMSKELEMKLETAKLRQVQVQGQGQGQGQSDSDSVSDSATTTTTTTLESDSEEPSIYRIIVQDSSNGYGRTRSTLASLHVTILSSDKSIFRVVATESQANAIVSSGLAIHIETYHIPKKYNDAASSDIMNAGPAYVSGYNGDTQTAAVADTGCGYGDIAAKYIHNDLPSSRIVAMNSWTAADAPGCYSVIADGVLDGDSGHGTHCLMSVLGGGEPGTGIGRGVAHGANLVCQAVEDYIDMSGQCAALYDDGYYLLGLPDDLGTLFDQAYNLGARVHSNSWGSDDAGAYTMDASKVDEYVWQNRDMLVTISAGNAGTDANADGKIDADSIGSPATAKNCLCVGASENQRSDNFPCDSQFNNQNDGRSTCANNENSIFTYGGAWADYPAEPYLSDPIAGNQQQVAGFSSRGPTDDGRVKPDVVCPGTFILSGYSPRYRQGYDSSPNPVNGLWQSKGYAFPYSGDYKYFSGTSMSNPLCAGCAVVIRDFLKKAHAHDASAALVKAILINTAVDLLDENNDGLNDNAFPIPNIHEGWGRVDLGAATSSSVGFRDETGAGLATGESFSDTFESDGTAPLRITLVWSDSPAAPDSAKTLVNNLDLRVTSPSGAVFRGNVLSGGWSVTGGSTDTVNNVENVFIENPESGTYTVQVLGTTVPYRQTFALSWTGRFSGPPPCQVNADCDDGDFCNGAEVCSSGVCTPAAAAPCAGQICDEANDVCVDCLTNADCADGNFCNGDEVCSNGACSAGTEPCPGQLCSETNDACVDCLDNTDCVDGEFCNGAETCVDGSCQTGSDPCPGQVCVEESDSCVACLSNTDCDDGNYCNGAETCDTVAGSCQTGVAPCAGQMCDESNDACVDCLADSDCADATFCNGAETCVSGSCQTGSDPCVGQMCDEANDVCAECLADSDCADATFCNGVETCVSGSCQTGSDPCTGGQICIESSDSCVDCLVDSDCDDSLYCTGTETCAAGICQAGASPCANGQSCIESSQTCVNCNNNGICETGEDCNNCASDCISGSASAGCDNDGICEPNIGEDCTNCNDCAFVLSGKKSNRYCCGFDTDCTDPRCSANGFQCDSNGVSNSESYCCGDGVCSASGEDISTCAVDCDTCGNAVCDAGESQCSCPADCGAAPGSETGTCDDGNDNDCDGLVDCDDPDCSEDPACAVSASCGDGVCSGAAGGEDCYSCGTDCPSRLSGKRSSRYCCGDGVCSSAENSAICPVDCGGSNSAQGANGGASNSNNAGSSSSSSSSTATVPVAISGAVVMLAIVGVVGKRLSARRQQQQQVQTQESEVPQLVQLAQLYAQQSPAVRMINGEEEEEEEQEVVVE
jgi:Subtilase family